MSYSSKETSVEDAQPVELYQFTIGATSYFYTSAEDVVTVGAQAYEPVAISRGNTSDGFEQRDYEFEVELPTSDPVAQLVVGQVPSVRIRLIVKRFHRNDTPTPEVRYVFDGYVHSHSFKNNLEITSIFAKSILSGTGIETPRRTCAGSCGHFLYEVGTCNVDSTLAIYRAANYPVSAQVGSVITVTGLSGAYTDGWFTGGYVEVVGSTDLRFVLDHVGDDLTLLIPFLVTPSNVNVFAGCDHSIGGTHGCGPKFDNVPNFGGFAFVPKKNPHEGLD